MSLLDTEEKFFCFHFFVHLSSVNPKVIGSFLVRRSVPLITLTDKNAMHAQRCSQNNRCHMGKYSIDILKHPNRRMRTIFLRMSCEPWGFCSRVLLEKVRSSKENVDISLNYCVTIIFSLTFIQIFIHFRFPLLNINQVFYSF